MLCHQSDVLFAFLDGILQTDFEPRSTMGNFEYNMGLLEHLRNKFIEYKIVQTEFVPRDTMENFEYFKVF